MARKQDKKKPSGDAGLAQVTITLTRAVLDALDAHAAREKRSRSNAADILIERALSLPTQAG